MPTFKNTCPACHHNAEPLNEVAEAYACQNPACDVRTFRPRAMLSLWERSLHQTEIKNQEAEPWK